MKNFKLSAIAIILATILCAGVLVSCDNTLPSGDASSESTKAETTLPAETTTGVTDQNKNNDDTEVNDPPKTD
jgi:hypothetical protein